ncbi:MAG: Gfo/Idh/MocA family oxidoreductase [Nitrospirae bacterium]|nr:Gfo/Idh/MocA family oxidoreductase [Nitrospirota bacterium]
MTTPIGIGLIGLGRHGLRYATHLLEGVPGGRLAAVCRRDAAAGEAYAGRHGLRYYRTPAELIADPQVGVVIVVTPPALALPIACEVIRQRKPLLIEKPLACRAAEARAIVQAAEEARVPLMVAQTLRFDSAVKAMKEGLAALGAPRYFTFTNRVEPRPEVLQDLEGYGGRGVLLEIGVHLLDLIRVLTGEEVAEVRCEMDRHGSMGPESRAFVTLRTVSGLPCLVDVSRVSGGRVGRAEYVAAEGQLMADWVGHRMRRIVSRDQADEWSTEPQPTIVSVLTAFLTALDQGTPMPVAGVDGLRAVEIADACYASAATGQWTAVSKT